MADGGWVVLGAAVGVLGPLLTTLLNDWLKNRRQDPYKKAAMEILKKKLDLGSSWKPLDDLCNIIGADEKDTKELLLMLGARASERNPKLWGLIDRNPLRGELSSAK
jgi:hypothetical protein